MSVSADAARRDEVVQHRSRPAVWILTGCVSVAAVGIYLFAYPFHDIQPTGFDIHAYIWQTKVVGHAPLSAVGARPGLPVMAALLGSIVHIAIPVQVTLLMPVLALVLALAVAGAVRLSFGLSPWVVPVVAAAVALYPGTARVVHGYQASLLVMAIATGGAAVLIHSSGRRAALALTAVLFLAACLSHVVLYALFAAVAGLYVVLSLPAFLRDRREGTPLLASDAVAATATVLPAGLLGAAGVYGWVGVPLRNTLNTSNVVTVLQQRTLQEVRRVRPLVVAPLAAIGAVFLRTVTWTREARGMARLGAAWLVVTLGGTIVGLVREAVAGHRFLLFSVPLPALAGLGAAGVGWVLARRRAVAWRVAGAAVTAGLVALIAWGGISYFYNRTYARTDPVYEELRAAGTYMDQYGGDRPLVFVVFRRGSLVGYSTKFRSYVIKAEMPQDVVARTLVYPGTLANLEARRPTLLPALHPWQKAFNQISLPAWQQVRPALGRGAVVLIAQGFAADPFRTAVARDPSRRIYPGLYVVEGPVRPLGTLPPRPRFGLIPGAAAAAAMFVIMGLVGVGFARMALLPSGATALDLALLAPAVGAGLSVVAGFLVAAAGGDPRGPLGIVVLPILAGTGFVLGRRRTGASG